jgi:hypothetical protein
MARRAIPRAHPWAVNRGIGGLLGRFTPTNPEDRKAPNQGMRQSMIAAVLFGLLGTVYFGVCSGSV